MTKKLSVTRWQNSRPSYGMRTGLPNLARIALDEFRVSSKNRALFFRFDGQAILRNHA